jgi:hypothetical protein
MKAFGSLLFAGLLAVTFLGATPGDCQIGGVQVPGASSIIPDKAQLLEQAKKLVADLTAMKQDPKLAPADKSKVDALLPKATAVNTELAKPQVEPSRLTQLAGQLGDLQKQAGALKGLGR